MSRRIPRIRLRHKTEEDILRILLQVSYGREKAAYETPLPFRLCQHVADRPAHVPPGATAGVRHFRNFGANFERYPPPERSLITCPASCTSCCRTWRCTSWPQWSTVIPRYPTYSPPTHSRSARNRTPAILRNNARQAKHYSARSLRLPLLDCDARRSDAALIAAAVTWYH